MLKRTRADWYQKNAIAIWFEVDQNAVNDTLTDDKSWIYCFMSESKRFLDVVVNEHVLQKPNLVCSIKSRIYLKRAQQSM